MCRAHNSQVDELIVLVALVLLVVVVVPVLLGHVPGAHNCARRTPTPCAAFSNFLVPVSKKIAVVEEYEEQAPVS